MGVGRAQKALFNWTEGLFMVNLRLSQPVLQTTRGAGLGNEIIPWGKAFIAAQEFGLKVLRPAWGLNVRGYHKDFETSRLDWPLHRALAIMPTITIGEASIAGKADYAAALEPYRAQVLSCTGPLVVRHASGMIGGFLGIRAARDYLRGQLLRPPHVARDVYAVQKKFDSAKLTIALHIRRGDFATLDQGPAPGQFNKTVPIRWYDNVATVLRKRYADRAQFVVYTDAPKDQEVLALCRKLNALSLPQRGRPVLSDLWGMANSDLLVCSVSAMSMLAAYLSSNQYVWYGPHLGETHGWRRIWALEDEARAGELGISGCPVGVDEPLYTRGIAASNDGSMSERSLLPLDIRMSLKPDKHDLVMRGAIKI